MIKIKKYQIEDYISDATQDALDLKADLVNGKVPASQLPSFVDDVIEVANYASLPIPGATGVIYITLDNNKVFRWTGSVYVEIASGVTNLSYTPGVSNGTVNSDTGSDATIPLAGTVNAGLFSAAEKSKLGGLELQNLQQVVNIGNAIVLPSNKNRGIDITIADLQNQYSNGVRVTLDAQTGTYSNNDAFVAAMNGQNPGSLPYAVGGFYAVVTGADNYSFVSEHNTGTASSSHYFASNAAGITSDFASFNTNNVNVFKVDSSGELTAAKLIKEGGSPSEILAADGSVITAGTNITISGGTISSTGGGGGSQDLQNVTDIGATTTNGITITVGDGGGDGITSFSSQGYGVYGESNETFGVYGTSPSATGVYGTSDNGYGVQGNSESGVAVYGSSQENIGVQGNSVFGTAISAYSEYGTGLYAASESGVGVSATSNSIGLEVNGNGTIAIEVNLGNSNKGLVINSGTSSTGNFIELDKNGVDKLVVNQAGELTATKLIKQGGFDYQFLKADGSVDNNAYLTSADLPSTLDLYATTFPDPVIAGYTALVRNIADTRYNTTAVDVSTGVITSVGQLVGSLVTDANIISGNPGVFDFKTIGNISRTSGTGQAEFFFRIYKRNLAGTETLIAQSDYTLPVTNGGYVEFSATALWNDGIFLDTDRVVLKYYANRLTSPVGSDPTYQFQFGGTSPVRSSAAIPTSVMPNIYLRDLADVENVDALNNEILYWNDPASLWEHSLAENLVPLATETQKGLVSTASQTFAGDKTFTGAIGASNLSGTNTGDNATNTQYSGLATSKQDTLQSTVNIKSINGNSILGSGDLTISGTGISSLNGLTGATQTFSILTNISGSPSFSSTGTNHQLRLPTASPNVDYGLVTNGSQSIGGSKIFESNPEIPVPAGNSATCIVLGAAGGGGATGALQIGDTVTYPNGQEIQRVKGVTSNIQTQLNNKASIIDVAEQTYSLSPTFTVTAPTTIVANTYKWQQVGSLVTVRVNLSYTTAGSFTTVVIPLPTDMPTPLSPTGFTAASDILYYGTGSFTTTTSNPATLARVTFLRRNAADTGFEFVMLYSTAIAARVVALTLQYFT